MNIFCCGKPIWIGESWLCLLDNHGKITQIEAELNNDLPVYIAKLSSGMLNVLQQMVEEVGGQLIADAEVLKCQEPFGEGTIVANYGQYIQLLNQIRRNKWRIREVATELEAVLSNILKFTGIQSKILLEQPGNLANFTLADDLVQTMAQYPLVESGSQTIGVSLELFCALEEMSVYLRALQSKGYQVVVYIHDDDDYKKVKYLKTDYIMYR